MEEMQILNGEYEELRARLEGRNLEEVGIIELRRIRHDYEALHELNLDLQERVRFDRTKDTVEVFETLRLGDELWTNVGEALKPIMEMLRTKAAMAMERTRQRRELIENQRRNRTTLDSLRANLETTRSLLGLNHDEAAQNIYNSIIEGLEANVRALEELDQSYNTRIQLLEQEIETLRFGGRLEELRELDRETEGLSEEQERLERERNRVIEEDREEEHDENREENHDEGRQRGYGIPGVTFDENNNGLEGIVERDAIVDDNREEHHEEYRDEENHDDEEGLGDLPPRPFRVDEHNLDEEHHEEENHDDEEGLDDLPPRPFRVGEHDLEDEHDDEEGLDALPPRPRGDEEHDDEEGLDDLPPRPAADESAEEDHHEEEHDEDTPVNATVRQPRSRLWQRLQPVFDAVKAFLLGAIAIHTGLAVNQAVNVDNNNTETQEQTENDTDMPMDMDEQENTNTDDHTNDSSEEEQQQEQQQTADQTSLEDDQKPAEEPQKPAEEPQQTADNTITLKPGETAYNPQTGVEVGYNGNAAVINDGQVTPQQDRNL